MREAWKWPNMLKGMLTYVPGLNGLRLRRASTGGTDSARYCYSVWLRHLVMLNTVGFEINSAVVGELGPGDSIGIGLAALLSGAAAYVGLDIFPFSAESDTLRVFDELADMYARKESIPDEREFPGVRPKLKSYEFPNDLMDNSRILERTRKIRNELETGLVNNQIVNYHAPWTSPDDITPASLDLIFSQAVLEHVDDLEETYRAMNSWLKPRGYASHVIDFGAHHLSPFWNGHWAYSDIEWQLVRGRREFLLNREPLSTHLCCAKKAGFEVARLTRESGDQGLEPDALSDRFRKFNADDAQTRVVTMVLRKPD